MTYRSRAAHIGLTQAHLAQVSGINHDTVNRLFGGKGSPHLSTLRRIEAALALEEIRLLNYLIGLHPEAAAQALALVRAARLAALDQTLTGGAGARPFGATEQAA